MSISVRKPFGLLLSAESARDIAYAAIQQRPGDDVALVVTPTWRYASVALCENIGHEGVPADHEMTNSSIANAPPWLLHIV